MKSEPEIINDNSVTFSFPKKSPEDIENKNKKNATFSWRLIEEQSSEHNNLLFQKSLEFDDQVNQQIVQNFQLVKKHHYSFFLHLIVFPPANIDEKFFFFTNLSSSSSSCDSSNYTPIKIDNHNTIHGYLNQFEREKKAILSGSVKTKKNLLFVFDGFLTFSAENFEKLIILLNEEIISEMRDYKFCLLVSVTEGNQLSFQIKNMYLEKTPYYSYSIVFFEFLYQIFKGSEGNYIFFSSDFFGKAIQHNKDYLGTLQFEKQKWEIYKKIAIYKNVDKINELELNSNLRDQIDLSYLRFKFALKIMKKFIQIVTNKSDGDTAIFMMNFIVSGYKNFNLNYSSSVRNPDMILLKLKETYLEKRIFEKVKNDSLVKKKMQHFISLLSEGQNSETGSKNTNNLIGGASFSNEQFSERKEKMISYIGVQKNPFEVFFNKLKLTFSDAFESIVESHFRFLSEKVPFLLVKDYFEFNNIVNPDFFGTLYKTIHTFSGRDEPIFIVKVFFDILKEKPESCTAQEVVQLLQSRLKEIPIYRDLDDDTIVDIYLYCQQLFEHLHLSKLSHKGIYLLEKNFFGKYGRK